MSTKPIHKSRHVFKKSAQNVVFPYELARTLRPLHNCLSMFNRFHIPQHGVIVIHAKICRHSSLCKYTTDPSVRSVTATTESLHMNQQTKFQHSHSNSCSLMWTKILKTKWINIPTMRWRLLSYQQLTINNSSNPICIHVYIITST